MYSRTRAVPYSSDTRWTWYYRSASNFSQLRFRSVGLALTECYKLSLLIRPHKGCKVLWWACLCVCVYVSVCEDISGTTHAIYIFCACCLCLWLGPPLASLRYVLYFCFVDDVFFSPHHPHDDNIEKSRYLGHGWSDFDKIWHSDAVPPSWPFWLLKNPRWRCLPSWKI